MSLFTGKGDDGTTKTFGCDQRISKGSNVAEALGALDEINSFLGLIKVRSIDNNKLNVLEKSFSEIIHGVQQNLFIIQAEVAGSDMTITEEKVLECEEIINTIEKELPPIKSFFISGGTEIAVICDISRTITRRAERRVVNAYEEKVIKIQQFSLAYLNRLSSLLYAMARFSNFILGVEEDKPNYQ